MLIIFVDLKEIRMKTNFIESLKQNGITIDKILNRTVIYAGGDHEKHLHYFVQYFKSKEHIRTVPYNPKRCVLCKHCIKFNCYIYDTEYDKFFVLGKCCLNKFLELQKTLTHNTSAPFPMKVDKPKRHKGMHCMHTYFKS